MPGEFEPHEGTLMIWPWRPGSWNYGAKAARAAFAEIAEAIAAYEQVYLFVRPQDKASAQELLSSDRIHLIEASTEDAWARDTGATFVVNDQGGRRGIQWEFNAWGGQYDGLYSHFEHDREVPERICSFLGDSFYNARPFVLEGGSIHVLGAILLLQKRKLKKSCVSIFRSRKSSGCLLVFTTMKPTAISIICAAL